MVLAGRREGPLREVAATHPDLALDPVPSDVTDEESVRALFATALERHGRLDLLFNNAGIGAAAARLERSRSSSGVPWSTTT